MSLLPRYPTALSLFPKYEKDMTDPHHHHHLNTNTSASVITDTRQEDLKKKKNKNKNLQPRNHQIFDPWNSASTGHQRAENPYSRTTEWRDTRREKLARQFRAGDTPPTLASEARDARGRGGQWQWVSKHEAARLELGVSDIRQYMGGIAKTGGHNAAEEQDKIDLLKKGDSSTPSFFSLTERERAFFKIGNSPSPSSSSSRSLVIDKIPSSSTKFGLHRKETTKSQTKRKGIFTSLTFYINGSTYPTVSDHRLKRLIAEEGGNLSLYLARKSVTHVILGLSTTTTTTTTNRCESTNANAKKEANKNPTGGGLLAAGKLQKESLSKTSGFGRGIKYVNVEWYVSFFLFL